MRWFLFRRVWGMPAALLPAQVASQPSAIAAGRGSPRGNAIQLSSFDVNTSKDTSYGALNCTSITAFNLQFL